MTTLVAEAPVQEADVHLMKALVYRGPGKKALEHCQRPKVTAPTDAIVKITNTTICGTDLQDRKSVV